jgi:hypothetical protein
VRSTLSVELPRTIGAVVLLAFALGVGLKAIAQVA